MKITIKYTALLLLLLPFASACNNGSPIADQSELTEQTKQQEVQKTELTVKSVVDLNSKVYASDGNIYVKNEKALHGWSKSSKPGGLIIKLAADENNLYALNEEKKLYFLGKDSSTWQPVPTSTVGTIETIFCDGWETAYLKANDNFYKLSAATNPTEETGITSDVMVKTKGGNNIYTASGGTVTGTSAPGQSSLGSVSGLGAVYSLTYSAVDNALYAGTSKGLKKLPMNEEGKLTGTAENPPGNWESTIKTDAAFAVLATGTNTGDAALYTSTSLGGSNDSKINGLWGYYYDRQNTWQQE